MNVLVHRKIYLSGDFRVANLSICLSAYYKGYVIFPFLLFLDKRTFIWRLLITRLISRVSPNTAIFFIFRSSCNALAFSTNCLVFMKLHNITKISMEMLTRDGLLASSWYSVFGIDFVWFQSKVIQSKVNMKCPWSNDMCLYSIWESVNLRDLSGSILRQK